MRTVTLGVLFIAVAGCSTEWPGDPYVEDHTAAQITKVADFDARLQKVIAETAQYIGMDKDEMRGVRVVFQDGDVHCGNREGVAGCYDSGSNTITVDVAQARCLESGTLSHEMLHVYLGGDPDHTNWRWSWKWWDPLYEILGMKPSCPGVR